MKLSAFSIVSSALLAASAFGLSTAQTRADVTIIGALSNFDCPNNTGQVCDEFEIEFIGPSVSNCYGTWGNYNYGMGHVSANAAGNGIIVDYRRTAHTSAPGVIEHFGVHLNNFGLITSRKFTWKRNGLPILSGAGSPPIPIPTSTVTPAGLVEVIENETPDQIIWVRRKVIEIEGQVQLAQLMPNDPIILNATDVSVDLEELSPGQTLSAVRPLPTTGGVMSQIIIVETHADIATWNPATQDYSHRPGALLSRAMSGTVTQNPACAAGTTITAQPQNTTARIGAAGVFTIAASAPAGAGQINYQWRHDGIDMIGEDTTILRIDPVTLADAGAYTCTITTDCGMTESAAARLNIFSCGADYDESGVLAVNDIFDFLFDWFAGNPRADFNHASGVQVQDIFDFLGAWFAGCP